MFVTIVAVALIAGVIGVMLGALLIPNIQVVEKPVEVVVEKRIEVPVERKVFVDRKVELPAAPFSYTPAEGGLRSATNDELRIALLMRDDIRKADAAEAMHYESTAIFNPGKSVKVLVNLNSTAMNRLSIERIKGVTVRALEGKGFEVLADDAKDGQWNTLVHVEVDLIDSNGSGRATVTLRQGMLGFSNRTWRKVSVGAAHYGSVEDFGRQPEDAVDKAVTKLATSAAADLAKAR
jgi:hypothetical protein